MRKKIIIIAILIILSSILIPYFSYWQSSDFLTLLYVVGITLAFLGVLLLYIKNPVWTLFLIPPVIIFGQVATLRIRDWYYEISIPEILIIVITVFFLLQIIAQKKFEKIKFAPLLILFGFYVFLSALSIGWVENISRALIALRILIFQLFTFFLVLNLVKTKKDLKLALLTLPLTGFLVSGQLVYKVVSLGGLFENYALAREAMITPVGKWVYIAAIIALTLPFTYFFLIRQKKIWLKLLLGGQMILGLIAIGLTLGKGEIIAVGAGLLYFFKKQPRQKYLIAIMLGLIILAAIFPFASYAEKFLERLSNTFNDPNTSFRLRELKVAPQIFLAHPLLGTGIGNLKLEYKNLLPWSVETESNNLFLQVILELGLLGLAILILIVRQIYLSLKKMRPLLENLEDKLIYLGFASTLIIVLVNAFVEVTLIGLYYGIIFWYILGLLIVQKNLLKKAKKYGD